MRPGFISNNFLESVMDICRESFGTLLGFSQESVINLSITKFGELIWRAYLESSPNQDLVSSNKFPRVCRGVLCESVRSLLVVCWEAGRNMSGV